VKPSDVKRSVLEELECGTRQTSNFMEQIAIDQGTLLGHLLPEASGKAESLRSRSLTERMRAGASALLSVYGKEGLNLSRSWDSDTARAWGAMAVGLVEGLPLDERLSLARSFAADSHFAVREWSWIGVRHIVVNEPTRSLAWLDRCTSDDDERVRRFASEVTRPRGVWCIHHPLLKKEPERATYLLEPLRTDPSDYVRKSVGNWLNDASKSRPNWVVEICRRWRIESPTRETEQICRRGMRSLAKIR
jgi:3-methyladenine DNA glycosylase AlkC